MKKMQYRSIKQILSKRKESLSSMKAQLIEETVQLSTIDDFSVHLAVDQLINHIKSEKEIVAEHQQTLIGIIRGKTGVCLNQQLFSRHLTAACYNKIYELQKFVHRPSHNYFILQGKMKIYAGRHQQGKSIIIRGPALKTLKSFKSEQEEQIESIYQSIEQFEMANMDYELVEQLEDFRGYGQYFNKEKDREGRKCKLIVQSGIIVRFPNVDPGELTLFNDGISAQEKIKLLQSFLVLQPLGRRIQSFASYFLFKKYIRNEQIYKRGEKSRCIYLVAKGEVGFQIKLSQQAADHANQSQSNSPKASTAQAELLNLSTQTIGKGNYFGQEEIILKTLRLQTARCLSSQCYLLELDKDKFEKLCQYTEFNEPVMKAVAVKQAQRLNKFVKARVVLGKFFEKGENESQDVQINKNPMLDRFAENRSSQSKKKGSQPKMMHGVVVRCVPSEPANEPPLNFSMLRANPDMYESTLKKFRKYNMRPVQKSKPQVNWNLTRVWKVLNLEDVLREESQISSPEGRKFFDSHRRYMHQVNQSKSLRPKTSHSTYRTKLQYIAYLQTFNKQSK